MHRRGQLGHAGAHAPLEVGLPGHDRLLRPPSARPQRWSSSASAVGILTGARDNEPGSRRQGSECQMEPGELVEACGRAVAGRLRELLGDELVAAYLVGSGALGGVAPGRSDVDMVAVCASEPPEERRRAVAAALGELALTWPL